ncbi:hypothetical protein B7494_g1761 [Chlorociboria aeruginascens]|nr:hypothetical protein B7494_g1761 [Chlorociboria aeruginascens]
MASASAIPSTSSALTDFISIGPRTSLYTPTQHVPGELVIICTWLGAAKKHISKYLSLYKQIAPGARILLIESNVPILVSSRSHIRSAVSAVVDTLAESGYYSTGNTVDGEKDMLLAEKDCNPSSSPRPKILLHTFSNGGTNTATQLLIQLHSVYHYPIPFCGLLLDSCPAKGTYWKSYNAMVLSLPRYVASQLLGALAVHFLLTLLYAWIGCGNENPASLMRRTLLDENISKLGIEETHVQAQMEKGRVCYLYSKEDRMCEWMDIREHAEDARRRGWIVEEEVFEGSAHCAHFSADVGRYAKAVERVWTGERKNEERAMNQTRSKL